jgi:hypothetical protein
MWSWELLTTVKAQTTTIYLRNYNRSNKPWEVDGERGGGGGLEGEVGWDVTDLCRCGCEAWWWRTRGRHRGPAAWRTPCPAASGSPWLQHEHKGFRSFSEVGKDESLADSEEDAPLISRISPWIDMARRRRIPEKRYWERRTPAERDGNCGDQGLVVVRPGGGH